MDNIIMFLEEFWGVTIVGGFTVGTFITFIILEIRRAIKDKTKFAEVDKALAIAQKAVETNDKTTAENAKLLSENKHLKTVIDATFTGLSYLAVASKLPIEEKLALQEQFKVVRDSHWELAKPVLIEAGVDVAEKGLKAAIEENAEIIVDVLGTGAEKAIDLLSKYTDGKEG